MVLDTVYSKTTRKNSGCGNLQEEKLKHKLIALFTVAISLVLAAVTVLMFLYSARKIAQSERDTLSSWLYNISDELHARDFVSHSELRQRESENDLQIMIRDTGRISAYNAKDDETRMALFATAERISAENGFNVMSLPLTNLRRTSPVSEFQFRSDRYISAVSIIPVTSQGYRTLTLVMKMNAAEPRVILLYLLSYIAGVIILSLTASGIISRAIKPAIESRKSQKQFIAAASHELRSPLTVIQANVAALPEQENTQKRIAIIKAECLRMTHLIGDMLTLASMDSGTWETSFEPVEVDTVLIDVFESFQPLYLRQNAGLTIKLPQNSLRHIKGDAERIKQVLGCLLDNALAYGTTGENKTVELEAFEQKGAIVINVIDHGAGLTRDQKNRIFDRFYRADQSRKDKQHFGLGLSIAKELIQLQRGELQIADTEGGGCTFQIILR